MHKNTHTSPSRLAFVTISFKKHSQRIKGALRDSHVKPTPTQPILVCFLIIPDGLWAPPAQVALIHFLNMLNKLFLLIASFQVPFRCFGFVMINLLSRFSLFSAPYTLCPHPLPYSIPLAQVQHHFVVPTSYCLLYALLF